MNQRLKRAIRTFSDAGIPRDVNAWTEADWRDLHEAMQAAVKKIAARHAARRCLHLDVHDVMTRINSDDCSPDE